MRTRLLPTFGAVTAVVVLQGVMGGSPAFAHTHPTPVELDSPAVVYVETRVKVDISLIEDNANAGTPIQLHRFTYSPVLAQGSGFAVDPSGVVVTDASLAHPDRTRAAVFAVNSAFHDFYNVPLPSDPFAKQASAPGGSPLVNQRLQTCYTPNTTNNTGGCVVSTTREVVVYPYVTSQTKYGELRAKVLTPDSDTSAVAVVKVGASSMPTVDLARSIGKAKAIAVLGFTGVPSAQQPLVEQFAHFTAEGSGVVNETGEDATKGTFKALVTALDAGLHGGPAVAETGQVIGFFQEPVPGEPLRIVGATDVRDALAKAAVTAQRGPTDAAFESAMHRFKNAQFQGSIPGFTQTLKLYPGHFDATRNLAVAQQKKGTAADKTGEGLPGAEPSGSGGGSNWLAATLIAMGLIVAVVAAALPYFLRRRRRAAHPAAPPARASAAKPTGAASVARPSAGGPPGPSGPRPASKAPTHAAAGPAAGSTQAPRGSSAAVGSQRSSAGVSVMAPAAAEPTDGRAAAPEQSTKTFCTNCGQRLAENHRFCGFCGHPVE